MKKRRFVMNVVLFLWIIAFVTSLNVSVSPVWAQGADPGPAADRIIFQEVDVDLAGAAVKAGDVDCYIYGLTPPQAEAIQDDPAVTLYHAPSGLVDIGINPCDTAFNPLSIREVRFALNYLMDRDYIVSQIYKGFAAPMVTFLSSFDPDFVTIYDIVAKYDFKYDPTTAGSIIDAAMTDAGATKVEGKWYYNNNPVTLKFIIRIEDERREIGDTFASSLEDVGFTVDRQYMSFGQAIDIVYGTDPADFEWHLYTEGWGKAAADKYDSVTINQMGAPWYGWLPGFLEAGWWQYENDTIDELGKRIYQGNFTDKAERDSLYKECTELVVLDSVKIWAATRLEIHLARTEVRGLTEDVGTGLRSLLNPREVYIPGQNTTTDPIRIGHLHVHTDTSCWNPIAGHDDVYSIDIWGAVCDPPMFPHPFSGLPQPLRADYTVDTAGPLGTLPVPSDAFMWNATSDIWEDVGTGVTATSKVTFDLSNYIGKKWHDGQTKTWADVLYGIHNIFEISYDATKSAIESSTANTYAIILEPFIGFKIDVVNDNLEVYLDFWHFSDDYIADYADMIGWQPPTAHYPLEVLAAMNIVVFEDQTLMYSDSASDSFGVPWMSVNLKAHAQLVNDALDDLVYSELASTFTAGGTVYATAQDLADRVTAAHAWFAAHDHIVISDGPFYLHAFDATVPYAELRRTEDPDYPFSAGEWYYGRPTAPEITKIGIPTVVPGGLASFVIEVSGLPPLGVKYLIRNPITAEILAIGDAEAITASKFLISLSANFTDAMEPGLYELTVAAYSEQVAFVSTAKEFFDVFNVIPLEDAFKDVGEAISSQLTTATDSLSDSIDNVVTATNNLMIVMVVVAILVIVAIAVPIVWKR